MKDPEAISTLFELVKIFGTAGIAWFIAWLMFRSYKDAIDARIDALEAAAQECQNDRRELHRQMHEFQMKVVHETTAVIAENTRVLSDMANG